jgi:hypothetical protein
MPAAGGRRPSDRQHRTTGARDRQIWRGRMPYDSGAAALVFSRRVAGRCARSFEWLLGSIPAPRACRRQGLERQRSLAQGHSPHGNGGDLIAREQHRSTDQRHDPQSPRWQTHDEPNANHDGDKPAKQDPIDSLTNDSTSRGRFELRVRCRAAHHAVAAAATSFGLAMSPWSAAGPTHRASSDLVASKAMPRIPTACRAG